MADSGKKKSSERSESLVFRRFRYTDDYKAVPTISANGRQTNSLVYLREWYLPVNEPGEYKRIVLIMRVLTAAALAGALGASALVPLPLVSKWFIPVLLLALIPMVYQIMGVVMLGNKPRHMERSQHDKSVIRSGHSAMAGFVIICIAALVFILYWVTSGFGSDEYSAFGLRDAGVAALIVLSALAEWGVYASFRKIKVETVENSAYRP